MKFALWLLMMVVGLGLLIWLFPPHEIEKRLKKAEARIKSERAWQAPVITQDQQGA